MQNKCKVCLTKNVKRTILFDIKEAVTLETNIVKYRKERKVSQSELADAVNVTRQTIISLEKGKYKASLVLAHKLAQFFDVAIEELFIFNEEDENI